MGTSLQMRNRKKKKPSREQSPRPLVGILSAMKGATLFVLLLEMSILVASVIGFCYLVLSTFYM